MKLALSSAALVALVNGSVVSADVILSNYPPTNDTNTTADVDNLRQKALSFAMPAGSVHDITSITLRLQNYITPADVAILEIRNHTGSSTAPGPTVVGTFTAPASAAATVGDFTFNPAGAVSLLPGTSYWIVLRGADTVTSFDWRGSSPAIAPTGIATYGGNSLFTTNAGTTWTTSATINTFRIEGVISAGHTIGLSSAGFLTGTFDGPGGLGSDPEILRLSNQQHFFYSINGIPSTLPSPYTQANAAGGGQTGGGFLDGARVAECALKLGFSYSNSGAHPVIDTRLMTRTYLASGYRVVGNMAAVVLLGNGKPVFSITGTGPIPFSTYQTGTPNFLQVEIQPLTGSINGNTLMPGTYRLAVPLSGSTTNPSMNSNTQPHEMTRDSTFRIVLGLAPCYANCDGSIASPLLTANDFQCFLDKFAAGDSGANCDGSTSAPALTPNDFQCFLDRYATGCS